MKLKVGMVLTVLFTLLASPSFAQRTLSFGPEGGVTFANLSFDPDEGETFKQKTGGAFGGFVNVGINDKLSFQPEFVYLMKGAKNDDFDFKVSVGLIQIPMLLHVKVPTSGMVTPFFNVGPGLGFRTSAKVEEFGEEDDIKDETKSTEFSMLFGGGVMIRNFSIEARYDLGLTDVNDDPSDDQSVKTRTFMLLFGYSIMR